MLRLERGVRLDCQPMFRRFSMNDRHTYDTTREEQNTTTKTETEVKKYRWIVAGKRWPGWLTLRREVLEHQAASRLP